MSQCAALMNEPNYDRLTHRRILKGGELYMVSAHAKEEQLPTFVEKAKAEHKQELEELLELQRLLEETAKEAEHPQIYRISVRSNW